jgi:hypothetical protein
VVVALLAVPAVPGRPVCPAPSRSGGSRFLTPL